MIKVKVWEDGDRDGKKKANVLDKERISMIRSEIYNTFTWSLTKEGANYWADVAGKLQAMAEPEIEPVEDDEGFTYVRLFTSEEGDVTLRIVDAEGKKCGWGTIIWITPKGRVCSYTSLGNDSGPQLAKV